MHLTLSPLAMATFFFVLATYACWRGNVVSGEIVRAINQHNPPDAQVAPYFWYPGKWRRVRAQYQALIPGGNLIKHHWLYVALMAAAMLGVFVSLMADQSVRLSI